MKLDAEKGTIAFMITIALMILPVTSFVMFTPYAQADEPLGSLDAWIVGNVVNGSAGIKVSCEATSTVGGQDPHTIYFNGTTDVAGDFNITVDSNTWNEDPEIQFYMVSIFSIYYKEVLPQKQIYVFQSNIYKGNESSVPPGSLECRDFPTSNLTITILNKTSGQPLEGVDVEISYERGDVPTPPFPTQVTTDIDGNASFPPVRSVNTTIEAIRDNFRYLSNTDEHNYVIVPDGGDTHATFELTEKPWTYTVLVDSVDVNFSNPVRIDFRREMDRTTITDESNFRLWKVDGDIDVPFDLTPRINNQYVDLESEEDLEFNTTYGLRIDNKLKDEGGSKPLWRAMTVFFTTELPPGVITGRIVDSVSSDPAEGILVRVLDQDIITAEDGLVHFPLIPAGTYRMDIDESYLFNESSKPGLVVEKGKTLDLGDIPIDPKPWGSLKVKVLSGGVPLEGALIRVIDELVREGDFALTTNSTGMAYFPRVLANAVTLEASALHHNTRGDMTFVSPGGEGYAEFNLVEDPLPISIEPVETNPDGTVHPTTDFLVHLPEAITFSTLNVSLWSTGIDGALLEEIPLTPPEKGADDLTYIVDPMISLPLETSYIMVVSDELLTLNDSLPVIWRNFEYEFRTPELPLIHINGTLLFEGQVLEGYLVTFGEFSAVVSEDGNFNITVDPDGVVETEFLVVNGSRYGYTSYEFEMSIDAGMVMQMGLINLLHVPGWYSTVPADGSENIEPDVVITMTFMESIIVPDEDQIDRLLSVIPEGSNAPIDGSYVFSNENKTVVFTPTEDLDPNSVYLIRISDDLKRWDNVTMFPLGNLTSFKIKPPSITISVIEPVDPSSMPIDAGIRLGFTYRVSKQVVEQSISVVPDVDGLMLEWISSSELMITAYLLPSTEYTLTLPAGVYGLDDEPILLDFEFVFTTGDGYGMGHSIGSPQVFPSPEEGWEPRENVKLSGVVENSSGYIVTATLTLDDEIILSVTDTVGSDGSWNINISAPDEEGSYKLMVTISMPGGPDADELEYTVDVGEVEANGEPDDNSWIIIVIVIIAVVLLVIIFAALMFTRKQKAMAEKEISSIDYTDVEGEWEDPEE